MKSSFNAFGQANKTYGAPSVPVWLGKVGAVPVGGTFDSSYVSEESFYPAGSPINITDKVITPVACWVVTAFSAGETYDTITVSPSIESIALAAGDAIMKLGSTFDTKSTAVAVVSYAASNGSATITVAHTSSALCAADDVLVVAAATGSSKAMKVVPTHYLYNDVYMGDIDSEAYATGAGVRYHADGILIDRTPAAPMADQMAVAVPGVLQVNG